MVQILFFFFFWEIAFVYGCFRRNDENGDESENQPKLGSFFNPSKSSSQTNNKSSISRGKYFQSKNLHLVSEF